MRVCVCVCVSCVRDCVVGRGDEWSPSVRCPPVSLTCFVDATPCVCRVCLLQTHNAWRSLVLGQKDAEEATGETTAQLADAPPPAQAGSFASKRNLSYPKLTLEDLH